MRLNGKMVTALTADDMRQLEADQREEDQNLDFKVKGYEGKDWGVELAKDVMGFANASGGVLLIGVQERKGDVPLSVPGIELENGDKDPMEKYERSLRDRLEPPVYGIEINKIVLENGRFVVAIGVPGSVTRPHRAKITGEGSGRGRWAIRRNKDTVDMTYAEIRSAFVDTMSFDAKVRAFQLDRCRYIQIALKEHVPGRGLVKPALGIMVVHVIPMARGSSAIDLRKARNLPHCFGRPGMLNMYAMQPNLDGLRVQVPHRGGQGQGSFQLYRDGRIEGVSTGYVVNEQPDEGSRLAFKATQFVLDAHSAVRAYIEGLSQLGLNPPFFVAVSLLNADNSRPAGIQDAFDATEADAPMIITEPAPIEHVKPQNVANYYGEMKSMFDHIWNAFGLMECHVFDRNGRVAR